MKKFLLILIIFAALVGGCSKSDENINFITEIKSPKELNDPKFTLGVVTGSSAETFVLKILPKATLKHFPSVSDMTLTLEQGKIDAGAYSQPPLEVAVKEQPEKFKLLDEPLLYTDVCMVVSPTPHIKNLEAQVNEFLAKHKADGSLEKIIKYWMEDKKQSFPTFPKLKMQLKL